MSQSDVGWCHCREYLCAAQAKKENVEERAGGAEVCVHVWEGNQRQGGSQTKVREGWEECGEEEEEAVLRQTVGKESWEEEQGSKVRRGTEEEGRAGK